jgi:dihydrofolate synthase/folylpolyglutamate synthase
MPDYERAVNYLLGFADFERTGRFRDRPDVEPMRALLRALGDPHLGRRTIHVAGSKGKGSTAAMIESILRAAGLRTGLFTSPHLHEYTERIRIDGAPISRAEFASLATSVRQAVERITPAMNERGFVTFDLLTAMGFLAFRDAPVNVQVIEVGLGGRVDSTNVFDSRKVVVITPISPEHTAILGDTIGQIAAEKAGIITPGCTVILGPQDDTAASDTVRRFAADANARLIDVAKELNVEIASVGISGQAIRINWQDHNIETTLPLLGRHQVGNAAVAAAAIALDPGIEDSAIGEGLATVKWPARAEVIHLRPLVVADGAHNPDSARALRQTLVDYCGANAATFIIGASSDKDIEGVAAELAPIASRVLAVRAGHHRAMDPGRILAAFGSLGITAEDVDSIPSAIERAMADSEGTGVICLTGSLFVAAAGREYFGLQGGVEDGI